MMIMFLDFLKAALLGIMLIPLSPVTAQEAFSTSKNSINVVLSDSEIRTSENAAISIKIIYHRNFIPEIPQLKEAFNPIEIKEYTETGDVKGDYYIRRIEITLQNIPPGDYLLNPIVVPLYDGDKVVDELKSNFIELKVLSSLYEDGEFIDDFSSMKKRTYTVFFLSGSIILLFTALFLLVYLTKKRKITFSREKDYTVLFEEANKLTSDRDFYCSLSEILREYLDSTIFLSVQSRTTEEFIPMAEEAGVLDESVSRDLFDFLKKSDRISFGKNSDKPIEREKDYRFCLDLMDYINDRIKQEVDK